MMTKLPCLVHPTRENEHIVQVEQKQFLNCEVFSKGSGSLKGVLKNNGGSLEF